MNKRWLWMLCVLLLCVALLCACDEQAGTSPTIPPVEGTPPAQEAPHTHTLTKHAAVAPTCTEAGCFEYWSCTDCEKSFTNAACTAELTDFALIAIDPTGHLSVTHHEATASGCTTAGNIQYWECLDCGAYFSDETFATEIAEKCLVVVSASHALTHHAAVAQSCTKQGNIEYWKCTECEKYFSDTAGTNEITDKSSVVILPMHQLDSNGYCATCGYQKGTEGLVYREHDTYAEVKGVGTASGDVRIASLYNGKPVTIIGDSAFRDCTGLTSITIPSSVTSIGRQAFDGCTGLTSLTIPSSVTSIGNYALRNCTGFTSITVESGNPVYHGENNCLIETASKILVFGCKNSVIPTDGSVTSIGDSAFYYCTGLQSITIPSSVTSIGSMSFYGCTGLTSIAIPSSVISIGSMAFASTWLIEVENGVSYVDKWVIECNRNMTSVSLRFDTVGIGSYAFALCTKLKRVTIPSNVTSIGDGAFHNCTELTSITIPSNVTVIGSEAFYGCMGLATRITIPSSVTSIGQQAFYGCTGLTSVVFENDSGWWIYTDFAATPVKNVFVGAWSDNAKMLTNGYCNYYWKRT